MHLNRTQMNADTKCKPQYLYRIESPYHHMITHTPHENTHKQSYGVHMYICTNKNIHGRANTAHFYHMLCTFCVEWTNHQKSVKSWTQKQEWLEPGTGYKKTTVLCFCILSHVRTQSTVLFNTYDYTKTEQWDRWRTCKVVA